MRREHLEHLIRAVAALTDQYEIVVVGSQSILGAVPNPPATLTESVEADMYPLGDPGIADIIDGSIGEGSPFQDRFGYYAEGVSPTTAILPDGWQSRLVKIQNKNTDLRIGLCLDPHDLAASKLAAGRDKDWTFVEEMLRHDIVNGDTVQDRIDGLPDTVSAPRKAALKRWVGARMDDIGPGIPRP